MNRLNEKDIRRCYDLLQHDPELGLTQLKAVEKNGIIGIGLFDNEKAFVAECVRYNTLGDLYVGVNPRSRELLDQFGGLRNRMRSLFLDVTADSPIEHITGIAVPKDVSLSGAARDMSGETSVLHDRERFFALGDPVPSARADQVAQWVSDDAWKYDLRQYVRVAGTALTGGGFFSRRVVFRRYRPYELKDVSDTIYPPSDAV